LARGAFIGLTVRHAQAHLTRAVLEGVAFGLRDSFELMKVAGLADVTQVRASGGGLRSSLWRQILADVLGAEIVTVTTMEGAAYGAALLAAVGLGEFATVTEACEAVVRVDGRTSPGHQIDAYEQTYQLYRALYPALKPTFEAINSMANSDEHGTL
jgi:xylulokinase